MGIINNDYKNNYYIKPSGTDDFLTKKVGVPARAVDLKEFLDLSFGPNNAENICLFNKRSDGRVANTFYPAKEQDKILRYVEKTKGTSQYVSISTYFKTKKKSPKEVLRTQSNIVHTYLLYQDLDFYKLNLSQTEVLQEIKEMVSKGELVCPSFYIFTGRGIQLCWRVIKFKNIEGYTNDQDFRLIQEHLYEKLRKFNSDSVSKSPSSVLRLTDSWHVTARKEVKTYFTNEEVLSLKDMVFFYDLIPSPDQKVVPKKKPLPSPKKVSKGKVVRNTQSWSEFTLNRQREEDIFIYVRTLQKRNQPLPVKRNWLALLLRFHALVSSSGNTKYAQKRVLELCNELDLTDTSVKELLRRSEPSERFYEDWVNDTWDKTKYLRGGMFYTNKRLLELMEIENDFELQWRMKTIKSRSNKYEAARKHFERLEKGEVKGTKEEYNSKRKMDKEMKLKELKSLLAANPNLKQKEIAEKLGVSRGWMSRLMKEI